MKTKLDELEDIFMVLYQTNKKGIKVFFAPGRVNLIGEHTDYNGGYVFPCALNFGTTLLIKENNISKFRFATTNFSQKGEFSSSQTIIKTGKEWYFYPLGIIDQFTRLGHTFTGLDFLYSGDIPNEAGLSSSASIEMVTSYAMNKIFSFGYDLLTLIKLSQKAENQFIGVNCGIMDQFAVGMGASGKAIFLNCTSLEYNLIPLNIQGYKLIISNTNKKRGLSDSKYNERRSQCDAALADLRKVKKIENLSSLGLEEFNEISHIIADPIIRKRAKHVISENQRVLDAVLLLKMGDLTGFGKLMNDSHASLRYDYEVTGPELDSLVDEAQKIKGVAGSRMTGAGFGGCTVSLVEENSVNQFIQQVGTNYNKKTNLKADFYITETGDGVKQIRE